MKPYDDMKHNPLSEKLVSVLSNKTQSDNPLFFRVLIAYYLAKVVGTMRPEIKTMDRGTIPVNMYAINLAPSGFSKGYSTNLIETQVIHKFKDFFLKNTLPIIGEQSLKDLAMERAARNGTDPDKERESVNIEFTKLGNFLFSFSEGTAPAVKQMRHKLLMAKTGAVNLEMDEIGSNLIANTEVLNSFLELYDVGRIKQKLIKNTAENVRSEEIDGCTPTNMMLFGTPDKLFDGGKTEDEFYSFLSTGYARRCLFGFVKNHTNDMLELDPAEILKRRTDGNNSKFLNDVANQLEKIAEPQNHGKQLLVDQAVTLEIIEYEMNCAKRASAMPEMQAIARAEMTHRYFKALKLAGTYAFIDGSANIKSNHLEEAIKLVEESGDALQELLKRDKPHVKLAKYLADVGSDVTYADLLEDVPTFKGSAAFKNEQMNLATAWGYKNNIVIKKSFVDGIEFFSADSLEETNLDEMVFSMSTDQAYNYQNHVYKWDNLHELVQEDGIHWVAHHLTNGHRNDDNIIPGFNMVVIDVDEGVSLATAKLLLKDHKCLFYTTKRHQTVDDDGTQHGDRFRILFPTNYKLELNTEDYKEFMQNVYDWLPFKVDDGTCDRPRKWMSHEGQFEYIDGEILDVLPFIPKSSKADEQKKRVTDLQSLDNLERWFIQKTGKGNRSNQMIKYALMLVDSGKDYDEVQDAVIALNSKMADSMDLSEIYSTIMKSVGNKLSKK